MSVRSLRLPALAGLIMASISAAAAADLPTAPVAEPVAAPVPGGWTFTIAPYLWLPSFSGTGGAGLLPKQKVENDNLLDDLEFGFLAVGEARYDRFSVGFDVIYTKLGNSTDTPKGIVADKVDVTSDGFIGTGYLGYALLNNDGWHLDAVAGGRVWSVGLDLEVEGGALDGRTFDDSDTWVDPLVGLKGRIDLPHNFYLAGWGLVGGFGVASDMTWDVMGGVGYDFTKNIGGFVGYRAIGVDFSDDSFVYDVTMQGPLAGIVFSF